MSASGGGSRGHNKTAVLAVMPVRAASCPVQSTPSQLSDTVKTQLWTRQTFPKHRPRAPGCSAVWTGVLPPGRRLAPGHRRAIVAVTRGLARAQLRPRVRTGWHQRQSCSGPRPASPNYLYCTGMLTMREAHVPYMIRRWPSQT